MAAVFTFVALTLAGCTLSAEGSQRLRSAHDGGASTAATGRARVSSGPGATTKSRFAVLSFRNPATWRDYSYSQGGELPDDSGFLTNEPLSPRCRISANGVPAIVRCPADSSYTDHLGPGGVEVDISVNYGTPQDRPAKGVDLDGYRADIDTGHAAMGNCLRPDARSAISVTATPPTDERQPGDVWLMACFGSHARTARREFIALTRTVSIHAQLSDSVPAPGARPCAAGQLSLAPGFGPQGVSDTDAASYAIRNVSTRTCVISGYPRIHSGVGPSTEPQRYHDGGGPYGPIEGVSPRPVYLRPGSYATFLISSWRCQSYITTTRRRPVEGITRITLPLAHGTKAVTLTATGHARPHTARITRCRTPLPTTYISPIHGY